MSAADWRCGGEFHLIWIYFSISCIWTNTHTYTHTRMQPTDLVKYFCFETSNQHLSVENRLWNKLSHWHARLISLSFSICKFKTKTQTSKTTELGRQKWTKNTFCSVNSTRMPLFWQTKCRRPYSQVPANCVSNDNSQEKKFPNVDSNGGNKQIWYPLSYANGTKLGQNFEKGSFWIIVKEECTALLIKKTFELSQNAAEECRKQS